MYVCVCHAVTDRQIRQAAILPPQACLALLKSWQQVGLGQVVLGNGTGSQDWRSRLGAYLDPLADKALLV